jgi:hypothetical protein
MILMQSRREEPERVVCFLEDNVSSSNAIVMVLMDLRSSGLFWFFTRKWKTALTCSRACFKLTSGIRSTDSEESTASSRFTFPVGSCDQSDDIVICGSFMETLAILLRVYNERIDVLICEVETPEGIAQSRGSLSSGLCSFAPTR